jgi:plastocyanin
MVRSTRRRIFASAVAALAATAVYPALTDMALPQEKRPTEHVVEIRKFQFAPQQLSVMPGDTVIWVNRDIVPHTATAADESWDTGPILPGKQISIRVSADFSARYLCRFHPMMKAVLSLSPDAG